jgi:KaiC/GvpD/RAD55 family RecA-like ATPase
MLLNTQETGFTKCSEVSIPDGFYNRMSTGCDEIDLMFGTEHFKGFMPGSAITICGTAGAGKTSSILQILELLNSQGKKAGFASGEEAQFQLAYTAKRLNVKNVDIAHINNVEVIAEAMQQYDIMVIDSFQALRSNDDNKLNKKAFLQYAQDLLLNAAKEHECLLIFVLHITTAGLPKGGTDIIHAVDVNVKVSVDKEDSTMRLFDVYKNRFGETKVHQAIMTSKGFDFQGEYVPPTEDSVEKADNKPVNEEREEAIMGITEPPHITLPRVMQDLGVGGQTAGILLREMVGKGKIKKYGRGAEAIWKFCKVGNEIYSNYQKEKVGV